MNKLKAIKILVAVLTFLLVFAMLCSVGIIVKRVKGSKKTSVEDVILSGSTINQISHSGGLTYVLIDNNKVEVLDKNNKKVFSVFLDKEVK